MVGYLKLVRVVIPVSVMIHVVRTEGILVILATVEGLIEKEFALDFLQNCPNFLELGH